MQLPLTADARLNAIVDVEIAARGSWAPVDLAAAYLAGGARFLQLRAKSLTGGQFLDLAWRVRDLTEAVGARLIVNDRADIARIVGAAGVHVGQDDLPPAAVRTILGDTAIVGLSTHDRNQIERGVEEPVSYVAIGPVFETVTKTSGHVPVGLEGVRCAASLARPRGLGVIAIGGITLSRAAGIIEAGATGVAVVADLLEGGDPEARVREYLARLNRAGKV